jgi:1,4-alpha-glucan branching enzyme
MNMKEKHEVKKAAGKVARSSKPEKAARTRSVNAKIPTKKPKKPVEAPARAEITFQLEAPQAEQVCIAGSFNEWDPMANVLRYDEDGRWGCILSLEPGEYEYRFVVDGEWCDDPENMLRRPNGFGTENCILII